MTPKERAKAILDTFPEDVISMSYDEGLALIEVGIRAAEHDALEAVAKYCDTQAEESAAGHEKSHGIDEAACAALAAHLAEYARSLKK